MGDASDSSVAGIVYSPCLGSLDVHIRNTDYVASGAVYRQEDYRLPKQHQSDSVRLCLVSLSQAPSHGRSHRNLPGSRYVLKSSGFWGILQGTLDETSRRRPYEVFDKFGIDVMSSVSIRVNIINQIPTSAPHQISAFPRAETLILIADPAVIKVESCSLQN